VTELAGEFAERLREELDFRQEARNATEVAAGLAGNNEVHVPVVHRELSTARVLVMEWLDGPSVREGDTIQDMGFDRARLANALLRCALKQMLVDGRFHADPHPGNVLVLQGGRLGLIDFGATGRLDALQQASMREMLVAVQQRDAGLLRQAVLEVATLRRRFDDEQLERALARFMAKRAEWAKASLAPGSVEELVRGELANLALLLRRTPRHLERIATMIERGDLRARVSLLADEQDARAVARLVNRAVLALLGGVVGVLSVMLLGIQGGPPFTGDTSLFQFFGYFGLFCATVLILRVLVAVLRDGVS
jgi:ubiquinone biosynthesis protein